MVGGNLTKGINMAKAARTISAAVGRRHYVFGYGSLISGESRSRTGETGDFINATVRGLRRRWTRRYGLRSSLPTMDPIIRGQTAVAVEYTGDEADWCNGVLFEVPEHELPSFDKREGGYTRTQLQASTVEAWPETKDSAVALDPTASFWTYCINEPSAADDDFPVPMSYLDVILQGALEVSPNFARHFIEHTHDWGSLLDDRECPIYVRHSVLARSAASNIDVLLAEMIPQHLERRRIAALWDESEAQSS